MKQVYAKFLCCSLILFYSGKSFSQETSQFDQLASINKQWLVQKDINPQLKQITGSVTGEVPLIQQHLRETEKLLRSRSVNHLTRQQQKIRKELLDILHDYWVRGVFPKNTFHKEKTPYFIDIFNNYCAVGYLMKMSGADQMARDIRRTQNFSYLKEIHHPQLSKWVENSGFSVDELALIQPAYSCYGTSIIEMHYNNAGPDVNEFIEINVYGCPGPGCTASPTRVDFYDEFGVLYKTVPRASFQSYFRTFGPGIEMYVIYYMFPPNESFADQGTIKLVHTTGGVDYNIAMYVYNSTGIYATYYNVWLPNAGQQSGLPTHYTLIENGTTPPGVSLNFCSLFCIPGGVNYFPELLPATIGSPNTDCFRIMPVSLLKFEHTVQNGKVILNWQTASETNTDHFEIEKSVDAINYSGIGTVTAAGSSNSIRDYSFIDHTPSSKNYYRLKQVDVDGKFSYSKILHARFDLTKPLLISPTIVRDQLHFTISRNQQELRNVSVYDLSGQKLLQLKPKSGDNNINVARLPAGAFILRLECSTGETYSQKFIKE